MLFLQKISTFKILEIFEHQTVCQNIFTFKKIIVLEKISLEFFLCPNSHLIYIFQKSHLSGLIILSNTF